MSIVVNICKYVYSSYLLVYYISAFIYIYMSIVYFIQLAMCLKNFFMGLPKVYVLNIFVYTYNIMHTNYVYKLTCHKKPAIGLLTQEFIIISQ